MLFRRALRDQKLGSFPQNGLCNWPVLELRGWARVLSGFHWVFGRWRPFEISGLLGFLGFSREFFFLAFVAREPGGISTGEDLGSFPPIQLATGHGRVLGAPQVLARFRERRDRLKSVVCQVFQAFGYFLRADFPGIGAGRQEETTARLDVK